jgi:outer membrane protein assembly factor BamB
MGGEIANCKLQIENWRVAAFSFLKAIARPLNFKFSIFNFQFSILLFFFAGIAVTTTSTAADPPAKLATPGPESWPTFRNGSQQRGIATSKLPAKLQLMWVEPSGAKDAMIKSTAAIAGGQVYAASLNGEVFCRDLKTGKKLWTYQSQVPANPNTFIPGFKAGVAVTEDTVYIGDEDGVFHAIDRATGTGKWKFETAAEITSSANFFDDKVLFASHDNSLYCLNVADGTKAWQFATQGQVYGSPPIAGGFTFVAGCDEHLRVIDVKTGQQVNDMPFGIQLISSPAVVDNVLYVGTYGNEILAIDWKNSLKVWAYTGGKARYDSSAAVTDKYVIAGSQDRKLHCIDRLTGDQVWTFGTKGHVDSSPVVVGERVFVGSSDGNVYGINLETGKEEWRHNDGRPITASPAVGEGCLVIGSESSTGKLYCFGSK